MISISMARIDTVMVFAIVSVVWKSQHIVLIPCAVSVQLNVLILSPAACLGRMIFFHCLPYLNKSGSNADELLPL